MTYRDVRRLPGAAAPARPAARQRGGRSPGPPPGRPGRGPGRASRCSTLSWPRCPGDPLPLLLAVAVLIRLTTPGPALFRQTRLGRDRRPFVLYKFRTMYTGNPDEEHRQYVRKLLTEDRPPTAGGEGVFKLEDDPRDHPGRPAAAAARASTSFPSCSTSSGATCHWSGRARRSPGKRR